MTYRHPLAVNLALTLMPKLAILLTASLLAACAGIWQTEAPITPSSYQTARDRMARTEGKLDEAIRLFEAAAKLDDELEYDEPEPLPFAARHWLGAALLEAKRPADAERAYREDIKAHPHNGWALLGLQQALKAQGKSDPAVDEDLAKSWARSDTWIRSSRF